MKKFMHEVTFDLIKSTKRGGFYETYNVPKQPEQFSGEWELVNILTHEGNVIAYWKRETFESS